MVSGVYFDALNIHPTEPNKDNITFDDAREKDKTE